MIHSLLANANPTSSRFRRVCKPNLTSSNTAPSIATSVAEFRSSSKCTPSTEAILGSRSQRARQGSSDASAQAGTYAHRNAGTSSAPAWLCSAPSII